MGLGITGISVVAVPLSLAWLVNSLWLGRKQEGMAAAENPPDLKSARVQGSTFKV
jgi:AAA family ATP:ADP antiporter